MPIRGHYYRTHRNHNTKRSWTSCGSLAKYRILIWKNDTTLTTKENNNKKDLEI
jgi:hypothetical protein